MLNVSIQRDVNISIHQQLVTQLSLQIASGILPEGTKLPSVRALSKKLSIHYNTCLAVYKELSAVGLIQSRPGSGMVVARFTKEVQPASLDNLELHQMAKVFTEMVLQKGYTWEEMQLALEMAKQKPQHLPRRFVFVDLHEDILPLFQAELSHCLNQPVETSLLETVSPDSSGDITYLVSRYHYQSLKARLAESDRIVLIDVGGGQQEIEHIKKLPDGKLVLIISQSSIILRMSESLIHGLRGYDLLVRTVLWNEGLDEIQSVLPYADLVISDVLCEVVLTPLTQKMIHRFQVIPDGERQRLQNLLSSFEV